MSNINELYKQNKYRVAERLYINYSDNLLNNINFEYEINFVKYNYNLIGNFFINNLDEKLNAEIIDYFKFNSNYFTFDTKFIKILELNPNLIIKNINKDNYDIYYSNINNLYNTINDNNNINNFNIYPNSIYLLIKITEFDKCLIFKLNKNNNLDIKDITIKQLQFNNECKDILIDELINNSSQMDYYNSESSRDNHYSNKIRKELLKYSKTFFLSNKKYEILKYFFDNFYYTQKCFFTYEIEFNKLKKYIYCEYKNNNLNNIISEIEIQIK